MHALMVHGAGGGGWEWNIWRGLFTAHGIDVVAPDLHPVSAGLEATRFDDYLAQVRTAIDALPRPRALVGASLGGLLAMACAGSADALVLVNPLPPAPWADRLPPREWPDRVPWQREARLVSTRQSLTDADDATALFAFRNWRDESGAVLRAAYAGVRVERPMCPALCFSSQGDDDVPPALTEALAADWNASLLRMPSSSHVGPLLGRDAGRMAVQAAGWLSRR